MKRYLTALTVAGLLVGQAGAAETAKARLTGAEGAVMVSRDGKLANASGPADLRLGDRVIAKTGKASVAYADGCLATLKPGAMVTIGAVSPCAGGAGLVTPTAGAAAQLLGLGEQGTALAIWGVTVLAFGLIAEDGGDGGGARPVSP